METTRNRGIDQVGVFDGGPRPCSLIPKPYEGNKKVTDLIQERVITQVCYRYPEVLWKKSLDRHKEKVYCQLY
jgi:hypothetical protein